jgi:signal peptidase II
VWGIDRIIKNFFVDGFAFFGKCIDFVFVINKGVAFSFFEFLGESLKWLVSGIVILVLVYIWKKKFIFSNPSIWGIFFGAAIGNLYDRFIYGGVIDYIKWHCFFEFAVFNFADIMIDFSLLLLFLVSFKKK